MSRPLTTAEQIVRELAEHRGIALEIYGSSFVGCGFCLGAHDSHSNSCPVFAAHHYAEYLRGRS